LIELILAVFIGDGCLDELALIVEELDRDAGDTVLALVEHSVVIDIVVDGSC